MKRLLGIIVTILWLGFLFCDQALQSEYDLALSNKQSSFGEMYGPYSFIYPYLKYGAFLSTLALVVSVWKKSD